jgi:acetate kinase
VVILQPWNERILTVYRPCGAFLEKSIGWPAHCWYRVKMTRRPILVLNAGSSSLKFAVFDGLERSWHGQIDGLGTHPHLLFAGGAKPAECDLPDGTQHDDALHRILAELADRGITPDGIAACGHRIVHGGLKFKAPVLVEDSRLGDLEALRTLAPLHNRYGLDAIDALRAAAPDLRQVACFDTAFHATVPPVASRYAIPAELDAAGYRRVGFHGLNFEHVVAELEQESGKPPGGRLLIFHLGNGCSICAVKDGRSVATTMGYTTLDGLVMGTRCGAIDPGVLIALQRDRGMSVDALEDLLYRHSGLLAVSGHSSDMRELARIDDAASRFAIEHFSYWAARQAGSLAVALGGVDALAFTGGIGSGSADVRAQIVSQLDWLGFKLDAAANRAHAHALGAPDSRGNIWIVEANEELAIARHVLALIG